MTMPQNKINHKNYTCELGKEMPISESHSVAMKRLYSHQLLKLLIRKNL